MIKKLLLLACVVTLTACPFGEDLGNHHRGTWYIQNNTQEELAIRISATTLIDGQPTYVDRGIIKPEETSLFRYFDLGLTEQTYFEALYEKNQPQKDFIWIEVRATSGTLLRRWELSDKDEPGKQFFNASSWNYEDLTPSKKLKQVQWTFEINPEDIE